MQIAQLIEMPTTVGASHDVVSPGRLFAVARLRMHGAAATIRPDQGQEAPTSLAASIAINQAQAGVGSLRSILVPSTGFDLRRRASIAIDQAEHGLSVLRAYRDGMQDFGDREVPISQLDPRMQVLLTEAIGRFDLAAAYADTSVPMPG